MPTSRNARPAAITDVQIVALILLAEGGVYTNDPADAGGPTKWGITIPVLMLWRGARVTAADIKALTRDEAAAIYTHLFVRPFDGLPDPLRVNVIDFGVNAGQRRAIITLQEIIGADVDGAIGAQTKNLAFARAWNPLYTGARLLFYENLIIAKPMNRKWRNGWRNRALSFLADNVVQSARRTIGQPAYGATGKAWAA